jgi:hypothetical protein
MPGPDFSAFEQRLRDAGVAPRHIRRTVAELDDHLEDLEYALRQRGVADDDARRQAFRQLGDLRDIAAAVAVRRELQCWYRRWPRAASLIYPLAWVAVLPLVPVVAGVQRAPSVARWSACLLLSAGFTASLLLAMQLSIRLS